MHLSIRLCLRMDLVCRFMESEIELNDAVQELHVVATQSDLYPVLVNMNGVALLLGLLNHENTDISIAVISLLQELTDVDTLTESEEQATLLIDTLVRSADVEKSPKIRTTVF